MAVIIYESRRKSGTTKNFAEGLGKSLGLKVYNVEDIDKIEEEYILCTHTAGLGEVPLKTQEFLRKNGEYIVGVVANGSSNFISKGLFGLAGDRIKNEYKCELIRKLDVGGTREDLIKVAKRCKVILGIKDESFDLNSIYAEEKSTFKNGVFNLVRI